MKTKIYLALACGLTFASVSKTGAQSDTLDLPEVVIADNRMDIPFSAQSRSIQIIRKSDMLAAPANSVAELLQYVPGVDIRQRGANGAQVDVGIRGGSFDQTLILLNGVKISDLQTGHHSMNLPVDWEAVERIEVLKGPAARIYGQNAFAGAINIVTRAPRQRFARVSLQAGDFGLGRVAAGISLPGKKSRQYLSYAHDFSSGYRYNTDYRLHTASFQQEIQTAGAPVNIFAGWSGRDFGANGFYGSPSFKEQYERLHTTLLSIDTRKTLGALVLSPRFYWRFNQDEYLFTRSNPQAFRNFHKTQNYGIELNARYSSAWGVSGFGVDAARQLLFSNRLGNRERTAIGVFAEHRFERGSVDITPGALMSYYSDFGARLLPGIEGGWQISPSWRAYWNAGYTFRVPTFTDLYYQDPGNIGNPDLRPESALAFEAGLKYLRPGLLASAAFFNRRSEDLIDWTKTRPSDRWQTRNLGNIVFNGWELALEASPAPKIGKFYLSYTFIEATQSQDAAFLSRYALDQLRHQLIGGADLRLGTHLSAGARVRYLDRVNLEDYTVADLRLRWQDKGWSIFTEATNLTNTAYSEANLVPMPGRWFSLGFSLEFWKR
ncbi:MAG: TonB-dependent receptor [Saprospiraceae bacterium]